MGTACSSPVPPNRGTHVAAGECLLATWSGRAEASQEEMWLGCNRIDAMARNHDASHPRGHLTIAVAALEPVFQFAHEAPVS